MTKDEALKLALEALDGLSEPYDVLKAQEAIREALAQPEQEPFGYFRYDMRLDAWVQNRDGQRPGTPFYTIPPQRTWVGLTDEEKNVMTWGNDIYHILELAEAKLKEKNGG